MGRKKLKRKPEPKRRIRWPRWTGISGSTLRDWLPIVGALLIPLLIFYGTTQITQEQANSEAKRAQAEQDLAEQRAQDEALQAYLDQMSQLMLDRKLLEAEPGDPVHTLAQARTSTVILRLDAEHSETVTRFLSDSGLARRTKTYPRLLSGIALPHAKLSDVSLPSVGLAEADLSGVDLSDADLTAANLHNADLSGADLRDANLSIADLSSADLRGADLSDALLGNTNLSHNARLNGADLSNVCLYKADLSDADLSDAVLSGAVLQWTSLIDAKGVTKEQLSAAKSIEGSTMPDGQELYDPYNYPDNPTFEEWLKDKKAQGRNEKNE
jgi:uncharacterized protein YjbI with pentapeptide repeats